MKTRLADVLSTNPFKAMSTTTNRVDPFYRTRDSFLLAEDFMSVEAVIISPKQYVWMELIELLLIRPDTELP